jgi:Family of unknown function (DUF6152)
MTPSTSAIRRIRSSAAFALMLLLIAPAGHAHHSIAGQFDMTQTVRLAGVVTKVEWTNPHVYLFLDSKESSGASVTWKLETLPVAMLRKAGIKKQMLITGEAVTMDICPARDGTTHLGFILNIQFADGRRFQFSRDPNGAVTAAK